MMSKDDHLRVIDFGTCGFSRQISQSLFQRIQSIRKSFPEETDAAEEYGSSSDDGFRGRASTFVGTAE